jgi:tetratricopeptide (TPR) repeat protein
MKSFLCFLIAGAAAVAAAATDAERLVEARRLAEAGMVELNNRRIPEAEADFREAARLLEGSPEGADPGELPVILNNLGVALTLRGESARAIPVLRRALHLADPKHAAALAIAVNLARAWIDEGAFAEAAPLLERVLEAGGDRSSPYRACALALRAQIDLHDKHPERALVHAVAALEVAGGEPLLVSRIRWIRAQALSAMGRRAEAAAEAGGLLQTTPTTWTLSERKILERFYRNVTARRNRGVPHI